MRLGETPVPIPNTMVKTQEADGTMLETAWESRWLPDYKKRIQEAFHEFRQNRIYRNVHEVRSVTVDLLNGMKHG